MIWLKDGLSDCVTLSLFQEQGGKLVETGERYRLNSPLHPGANGHANRRVLRQRPERRVADRPRQRSQVSGSTTAAYKTPAIAPAA